MHPLDHIGIAVQNLEQSIALYEKTFGYSLELREKVVEHKVEVAFLRLPNTKIELLAPLDNSSTVAKFLTKRGEGLHHLCYRVQDIHAELEALKKKGIELIDKTPRQGAHNSLVAFIHPKSCAGVLTELCQPQ